MDTGSQLCVTYCMSYGAPFDAKFIPSQPTLYAMCQYFPLCSAVFECT